MSKNSTNLGLRLYSSTEDTAELSSTWFSENFGYTNSNLTKIDDAIGRTNTSLTKTNETVANINSDLQQVKDGYLPLGGGTMVGDITLDGDAKLIGNVEGNVVGSLDGNASTATKAVQDGDGNVISTSYPIICPNAGNHNSIYRGKDITAKFTDGSLFANIANGTFEDLFIGDYFVATCNNVTTNWRLAGFDIYYNCGDTALTRHHAVVIPDAALLTANMNADRVTTGGYVGSRMYKETMPDLATKIGAMVGTDHLVKYRDLFTTSVDTTVASSGYPGWKGASNDWTWSDITVRLCSEVDVYGAPVFSSSGYDVGLANMQLPLFVLNPALRVEANRTWWWLSSVRSSGDFCLVHGYGNSYRYWASNVFGVRPRFLVG